MLDYIGPVATVLSGVVALGSLVWAAQSWFNSKFNNLREFVENKIDRLQDNLNKKLEYHEQHDDQRFNKVDSDLLAIKLRNASRDGLALNILEELNKGTANRVTKAQIPN